jgi:hypothetical protein
MGFWPVVAWVLRLATVSRLGLEVGEVLERSQRPEVVPDVVDGALFHLAFFVRAVGVAGPGDNGQGAEEVQKGAIEADEGSHALGYRCEHVICDELFGGALEKEEGMEKGAVKGFLPLGMSELQVEEAAVALDHGQAVELPFVIPIGDGAEVAPVHLALLPWQGLKPDEGLLLPELAAKGPEVILEDGEASVKA